MSRQNQKSSWPLLCILACLFILSAVAPRTWERLDRAQPTGETAGPEASPAGTPIAAAPAAAPATASVVASPATASVVASPATASVVETQQFPLLVIPQAAAAPVAVQPAGKIASQYQEVPQPVSPAALEAELTAGLGGRAPTKSQLDSMLSAASEETLAMAAVDVDPSEGLTDPRSTPAAAVAHDAQPAAAATASDQEPQPWNDPVLVAAADPDDASGEAPLSEVASSSLAPVAAPARAVVEAPPALGDWVARQRPLDEPDEPVHSKAAVAAAARPRFHFPQPTILRQGLEDLSCECETGLWAMETLRQIDKLLDGLSLHSEAAGQAVERLVRLVEIADLLANRLEDDMLARRLRQTAYTLQRRVHVWQAAAGTLQREEARQLLEHVERFEQTGLVSDAQRLTDDWRRLEADSDADRQQLGAWLEDEYRNANFRTVITGELLNRLTPAPQEEYAAVDDTILGMPVRGNSVSANRTAVQLVPDPDQLRMKFLVAGAIGAMTSSDMGVAKFYDRSDSVFYAGKDLLVDARGIRLFPAQISVHNDTQLRGVKTALDPIPLVGWFAQNIARTQHELVQPWASAEAEQKISAKAKARVDEEVYARLNHGVGELRERLFVPLDRLGLTPEQISAETTAERMTMRLRIAGDEQSGGYTPRPRALSDSLLSLQINDTAINNIMAQLQLDGRTFTLPELSKYVAGKFNRPDAWPCEPDHEDVEVTFAAKDSIQVRCREGQLVLTLSVARLAKGARQWKDFQVRVAYRPEVNGRSAELVRDGVVQLISSRLSNAGQMAVRGIFSRTFSKNRRWNLTPTVLAENPGLAGTAITQFEIDGGWLALALGPQTTVAQVSPTRR